MAEFMPMTPSQVASGIRELDDLANVLCLPDQERRDILGLSGSTYRLWQSGLHTAVGLVAPELTRRLSYALPLMRRMAANLPSARMGYDGHQSRPMFD